MKNMFMLVLLVTCLSSINAAYFKVITGRSKTWSDEEGNQGDNGKPTECLEKSRTQGDEKNSYGDDIGVQCCKVVDNVVKIGRYFSPAEANGNSKCVVAGAGSTKQKLCCRGVDYETAQALCVDRGDRLCTYDEAKDPTIQAARYDGSGCSYDAFHVWTSTECGGHMGVTGRTSWETRANDADSKPDACISDDDTHGPTSNSYGDFMGTQCCQDKASGVEIGRFFAPRPADEEQLPAECVAKGAGSTKQKLCCFGVDYCTAKALCAKEGYRLCTKAEAERDLPRYDGSGCSFDAFHVWTSDLCGENTEPSCGILDCSAVDIDGYLTRCSNVFDRTLPQQISDLEGELSRVEREYQSADTLLSNSLTTAYIAADAVVTNAYVAADVVVTSEYVAADVVVTEAYVAADDVVTEAYVAADVVVTEAYEAAVDALRTELSNDMEALENDAEARFAKIEKILGMIADIGGDPEAASTTPLIDFSNNNHILLFSLFANIILIILACYMYNKYKSNKMKHYGKVAAFVDSDSENQPLQR